MNQVTFLGDVSLLTPSMKSRYCLHGYYVFNLEYVVSSRAELPKKNKVNLHGSKVSFSSIFGKPPLAVSLANNHIMDYGVKGYKETVRFLQESSIQHFGAGSIETNYSNPIIIDVNETNLALIAYGFFDEKEGDYGVAVFDEARATTDIALAKSQEADAIVVSMHWGEEEAPLHNANQQEIDASWLIKAWIGRWSSPTLHSTLRGLQGKIYFTVSGIVFS